MICPGLVRWISVGVEFSQFGIMLVPGLVSEWKWMVGVSGST